MPAHHDKLMVKVQEHETTIAGLTSDNTTLHTAIAAAETRITELYEDQARMEDELAARNVVTEKLRNQIRELEKEERDLRKRYNDQVSTHVLISVFDTLLSFSFFLDTNIRRRAPIILRQRTAPEIQDSKSHTGSS
jgi:predicted nuclease with TOPRIM domain